MQLLILPTLVDADMIRDADRFKMDLIGGLERTLQGQVKPSSQSLDLFESTS
jgi:hypothetical protein